MACKIQSIAVLIILSVCTIGFSSAETILVSDGWQAFQNVNDATTIGTGGLSAVGFGVQSQLGNPALISNKKLDRIIYSHQSRFAGMVNSDYLSTKIRLQDKIVLGLALIYEGVSDIPLTTGLLLDWGEDGIPGTGDNGEGNGLFDEGERLDAQAISDFNQRQLGVHLATFFNFRNSTIGLGFKVLNHSIGKYKGNGFGLDIGFIKELPSATMVGLTIYDVLNSWMVWDSGTIERTAPSMRIGITQLVQPNFLPFKMQLIGNGRWLSREIAESDLKIGATTIVLSCGMELIFKDKFNLRFSQDELGLAAVGLGLQWPRIGINYASRLEPDRPGIGSSHYISFDLDPSLLKQISSSF